LRHGEVIAPALFWCLVDHALRYCFLFFSGQPFYCVSDLVRESIGSPQRRWMRLSTKAAQTCEMTNGNTTQVTTATPSVAGQP
jgi:hypothetical protein